MAPTTRPRDRKAACTVDACIASSKVRVVVKSANEEWIVTSAAATFPA
jgi:hypothetical protein